MSKNEKHDVYSLIPKRSWDGIVGGMAAAGLYQATTSLDAVLWALFAEPEEAEDLCTERLLPPMSRSKECPEFGGMSRLRDMGSTAVAAGLQTIATFVRDGDGSSDVRMAQLYWFEPTMGAWVDAAIVEAAFREVERSSVTAERIVVCARKWARQERLSKNEANLLSRAASEAQTRLYSYDEEIIRAANYLAENLRIVKGWREIELGFSPGAIMRTAAMGMADLRRANPEDLDRDSSEWAELEHQAMAVLSETAFNAVISFPW
jgi:hypothetical protein